MLKFKPLKQPRISETVMNQLKEAILLGDFKSGEKLPSERELTEQFQVSRGVIREAIRALEITGFVHTRQGPAGGAFVTELSFDHVGNAFLDLFLANRVSIPEMAYVRQLIEPEVARLAAVNISEEGKERLTQAQKREFFPAENDSELIKVNQEIHRILAELCQNHFLEAISKSLLKLTGEMVLALDPFHTKLHGPGEHAQLIKAVINGDATAASVAMTEHINHFCEKLIKMEKIYRERLDLNRNTESDRKA